MAAMTQEQSVFEAKLTGLTMPVVLRPPRPLSDLELMTFSRKNKPYRIERNTRGELEIMTPVGGSGSRWEALVIRELGFWAEDNGGVAFSSNGGFNLPDGSMLSPDAAWLSDTRWNGLTAEQQESYPPLCPEFVVEILSASDSLATLQTKMSVWIKNGAELAWLIDPYGATVSIYRADAEVEVMERPDFVEADGPVAGFRLTTAKLWG